MKRTRITTLLFLLAAGSLGCAHGPAVGFEHVLCWMHQCGGLRRLPPHSCPPCPYYHYADCCWKQGIPGGDDLLAPAERLPSGIVPGSDAESFDWTEAAD